MPLIRPATPKDAATMSRIHALPYHALASIPIVATSERLR